MRIAHASISENGSANGLKGDQTGKEVVVRSWYNKPWNVILRAKSLSVREVIASVMEQACLNDCIGYSQNDRNSLFYEVLKVPQVYNITNKCNCDCSSLVAISCYLAGVPKEFIMVDGNCLTTFNMENMLMKSDLFEKITNTQILSTDKYLCRGDILLNTQHHVAVVLDDGIELKGGIEVKSNYNINTYTLQRSIKNDGFFSFPKFGIDGEYGNETSQGIQSVVIRKNPSKFYEVVAWVQEIIGAKVDGYFGNETYDKLINYQRSHNLHYIDGVIGTETLHCMLREKGVKC